MGEPPAPGYDPPVPSDTSGLPARYRNPTRVAVGGYGVVLRADDVELGRPVAIKRLHARQNEDEEARSRFLREARRTAGLQHPHLVQVLDLGQDSTGHPYLVYEWVDGSDLSTLPPPVPTRDLRRIGISIAQALEALHQEGIVHRDVKPANVLLREGAHPLLADLGMAHVTDGATIQTAEGVLLGTPAFMAPELWRGEPATPASDQFAWAGSLLWLAGGPLPWGSDDVEDIIATCTAPPQLEVPPEVLADAPDLLATLRRALSPDPADRFPDLAALAQALAPPGPRARLAPTRRIPSPDSAPTRDSANPDAAPTRSIPAPASPRSGRGPWVLAGLAGASLVTLLAFRPSPPPEPPAPSAHPPIEAPAEAPELATLRQAVENWQRSAPTALEDDDAFRTAVRHDGALVLRWNRLLLACEGVLPLLPDHAAVEALEQAEYEHGFRFLARIRRLRTATLEKIRSGHLLEVGSLAHGAEVDWEIVRSTIRHLEALHARSATHPAVAGSIGAAIARLLPNAGLKEDPLVRSSIALRGLFLRDLSRWLREARAPRDRLRLAGGAYYLMESVIRAEDHPPVAWEALLGHLAAVVQDDLPPELALRQVRIAAGLARNTMRGVRVVWNGNHSPATRAALTAALDRLDQGGPEAAGLRREVGQWISRRVARATYDIPPALAPIVERALAMADG
jgi:serine/threonine protein kinase